MLVKGVAGYMMLSKLLMLRSVGCCALACRFLAAI